MTSFPQNIPFVKMQATGNDFILIDNRSRLLSEESLSVLAPVISDRTYGVGSDGLITLEEGDAGRLVMRYKNPDGSDAGMCGNGGRCFTLFARSLGYGDQITFTVHDREYEADVTGSTDGLPVHGAGRTAGQEPVTGRTPSEGDSEKATSDGDFSIKLRFPLETTVEELSADGKQLLKIYTNTEHIVLEMNPSYLNDDDLLISEGRRLRYHKQFAPAGTNVNFITENGTESVILRTYERGVEGLTLACGTGAVASAIGRHHLTSAGEGSFVYSVHTRGGLLTVRFSSSGSPAQYSNISLEGPAAPVFEGVFYTDQ